MAMDCVAEPQEPSRTRSNQTLPTRSKTHLGVGSGARGLPPRQRNRRPATRAAARCARAVGIANAHPLRVRLEVHLIDEGCSALVSMRVRWRTRPTL